MDTRNIEGRKGNNMEVRLVTRASNITTGWFFGEWIGMGSGHTSRICQRIILITNCIEDRD